MMVYRSETFRTSNDTREDLPVMAQSELESTIETAAEKPVSASVDGVTVTQRPIGDLIAADRYLSAKRAARKRSRGIRFSQIVPPGADG